MLLSELRQEIAIEANSIRQTLADLAIALQEAGGNPLSATQRTAAAAYMAQCYTGVENVLKRILRYCDVRLPTGGDWHIALLKLFRIGARQVPSLIDDTLFAALSDLRRFRHVVIHRYGFTLDSETVLLKGKDADAVLSKFFIAVEQYLVHEEEAANP